MRARTFVSGLIVLGMLAVPLAAAGVHMNEYDHLDVGKAHLFPDKDCRPWDSCPNLEEISWAQYDVRDEVASAWEEHDANGDDELPVYVVNAYSGTSPSFRVCLYEDDKDRIGCNDSWDDTKTSAERTSGELPRETAYMRVMLFHGLDADYNLRIWS